MLIFFFILSFRLTKNRLIFFYLQIRSVKIQVWIIVKVFVYFVMEKYASIKKIIFAESLHWKLLVIGKYSIYIYALWFYQYQGRTLFCLFIYGFFQIKVGSLQFYHGWNIWHCSVLYKLVRNSVLIIYKTLLSVFNFKDIFVFAIFPIFIHIF